MDKGAKRLADAVQSVVDLVETEDLHDVTGVDLDPELIAAAEQETGDEERSRRLESDAEAVQVLTIHRSKGLEFPVVYYPYLWEPSFIPSGVPVAFHDPDAGDRRTIDVGLEGPDFDAHKRQELVEQRNRGQLPDLPGRAFWIATGLRALEARVRSAALSEKPSRMLRASPTVDPPLDGGPMP